MFVEEKISVREISRRTGIPQPTIWRWLEKEAES